MKPLYLAIQPLTNDWVTIDQVLDLIDLIIDYLSTKLAKSTISTHWLMID